MQYPNISQFKDGWQSTSVTANSDFAILIGPPSLWTNVQSASKNVQGSVIGNGASIHDFTFRLTQETKDAALGTGTIGDLLNGANVTVKQDPNGVDMLAYDDPSLVDVVGNWVPAHGFSNFANPVPFFRATPNLTFAGGSAIYSTSKPSANHLIFMCAYFPQGETFANLKDVGFDFGGYADETNGQDGAVACKLGDTGSYQVGSLHVAAPFDGSYGLFSDINTTTSYGRITMCMATNGTSTSIAARQIGVAAHTLASGASLGNATGGTNWTTTIAPSVEINLGQDCSTGVGVHCMGIRNYSAAIDLAEVEKVLLFMNKTGKLPNWWN